MTPESRSPRPFGQLIGIRGDALNRRRCGRTAELRADGHRRRRLDRVDGVLSVVRDVLGPASAVVVAKLVPTCGSAYQLAAYCAPMELRSPSEGPC